MAARAIPGAAVVISVPQNISVAHARLPQAYEQAKAALANCASIDECQTWANKAEALASYAKQADDDTLRKQADRIQARAIRRCGELLKTFNTGPQGGRPKNDDGTDTVSQRQAASDAGLSERQRVTAVRVANVPSQDFETAVDSEAPPTVTKLAEMGKKTREAPPGFKRATEAIGTLRRFAEFCNSNSPEDVAGGVYDYEIAALKQHVGVIDGWLDRFVINLGKD